MMIIGSLLKAISADTAGYIALNNGFLFMKKIAKDLNESKMQKSNV